jgi:hypothetical protein
VPLAGAAKEGYVFMGCGHYFAQMAAVPLA